MKFKTATDFRKSLEARIQGIATRTGQDLQSLRRKVAFDRLLARIFSESNSQFYLKGGYAMELRVAEARVTKDIDLTCLIRPTANEQINDIILDELQKYASKDLNDFFFYQISKSSMDLDNAPYGGSRYQVSSLIDGKLFVRFQLDVGADIVLDKVEFIKGVDWLEFCDVKSPTFPTISIEQQFAEKLHAYSLPLGNRINSRVKDLIDMVLLINIRDINVEAFQKMLKVIFKVRNTHSLPKLLDSPPLEWERPFNALAEECGLVQDMTLHFEKVSHFYQIHHAPITKEEWELGHQFLSEYNNLIAPYTIVLAFDETGSYGTAVLIQFNKQKYLLTPTHVAREVKNAKRIRLITNFDDRRRVYPARDPRDFVVKEWDQNFKTEMLEEVLKHIPKDLSVIELSPQIQNFLENYKQFYLVNDVSHIKPQDALIAFGAIGSEFTEDNTLNGTAYGSWGSLVEL